MKQTARYGKQLARSKAEFRGHRLLHARRPFIGALVPRHLRTASQSRPEQARRLPGALRLRPRNKVGEFGRRPLRRSN